MTGDGDDAGADSGDVGSSDGRDGTSDGARDDRLHRVGRDDDLAPGDRLVAELDGREIAVFDVDGEYYAVANYCTHQGGPVCEGLLSGALDVDADGELVYADEGRVLSCPWHGWEFDVTTGEHLAPSGFRLPTYEVVVEDGELFVSV